MGRLDPRHIAPRLDEQAPLDAIAVPLQRGVRATMGRGRARDALRGSWLGHPVHPMLTDLPIGFWTSAWMLDLVGGERDARAAQSLVGMGLLCAIPTAASGAADWSELRSDARRSGLVHAGANVAATALYAWSYAARHRGDRRKGVAIGMAGAAAATVGGYLGGHLVYRRGAGVEGAGR